MAKYDTYVLKIDIGREGQRAALEVSILFEDGDNLTTVIAAARDRLRSEAIAMKNSGFIDAIKQ